MKRVLSISLTLLLTALLVLSLSFSAFAKSGSFICDDRDVFSTSEFSEYEEAAQALYNKSSVCVCYMVTTDLKGKTAKDYAESFVSASAPSKDALVLVDSYDPSDSTAAVYAFGSAEQYSDSADRLTAAYNSYETYTDGANAYLSLAGEIITGDTSYSGRTDDVSAPDGQLIVDGAELLSDEEETALTNKASQLSDKNNCSFVIVTVPALNGKTATAYADDYYDYHGYKPDGVLLLIALDNGKGSRAWAISTSGSCIKSFSESEQANVIDQIKPDLSSKNWYKAFDKYLSGVEYSISPHVAWYWIPLSIAIGFGIAILIMLGFKAQLKSVKMQAGAREYVRQGSMVVTASRDTFLYHTITRTAKPKDNGSGSGGTHIGSSGSSHGGSSGTF